MSGFLDTSVVVRYLRGEPPEMADRAAEIIEGSPELYITDVVLAETAHVLTSVYRVARDMVVDGLVALVRRRNITTFGLDKALVLQGLMFCRPAGRVSVPDAMIWAAARSSGVGAVYSFDERFPLDGVTIRRGPER
jgi:predicted nucleic acid-binding protein